MFALVSDGHLRRMTWAKHPLLWGDAYFSLQQIVDYCVQHGLDLIAAGDMFDKQLPDAASVKAMYSACDQMQDAGLHIYFIQGQHERSVYETWIGVHPWPIHIHKRSFTIQGYRFYGLDWTPADVVRRELSAIPEDTDFLVAHQVWAEFMRFGPECSFGDVHHASYLLTGDYHVHLRRTSANAQGLPLQVYSPGSMHMQATDEPPVKQFFACQIEGGNFVFHDVPLRTRPFHEFDLRTAEDVLEFVNSTIVQILEASQARMDLPEHIRTPIVVIRYDEEVDTGDISPYNLLREATQNVHGFLTPYVVEVEDVVVRPPSLDVQSNVLQVCLDQVEPPGEVRDITLRILNSQNPTLEIETMAAEAMARLSAPQQGSSDAAAQS